MNKKPQKPLVNGPKFQGPMVLKRIVSQPLGNGTRRPR